MKKYFRAKKQAFSQSSFKLSIGRVALFVALSLALSAALFAVNAYNKRGATSQPLPENAETTPQSFEPVNAPVIALTQSDNLQVKVVTLTARGFEPDELLSSNGRFILAIENISGLPNVSMALSNNAKAALQTVQMQKGRVDWVKAFDLPAGEYVLSEASHPNWKCTITVKPK